MMQRNEAKSIWVICKFPEELYLFILLIQSAAENQFWVPWELIIYVISWVIFHDCQQSVFPLLEGNFDAIGPDFLRNLF